MGAAAMAYALWTQFLKHNPANRSGSTAIVSYWSGGHGSMLLYSLLYLSDYDVPSMRSSVSENGGAKRRVIPSVVWRPASRSPRDHLGRDLATVSASRLPRRGSRRALTGLGTRLSITIRPAEFTACRTRERAIGCWARSGILARPSASTYGWWQRQTRISANSWACHAPRWFTKCGNWELKRAGRTERGPVRWLTMGLRSNGLAPLGVLRGYALLFCGDIPRKVRPG